MNCNQFYPAGRVIGYYYDYDYVNTSLAFTIPITIPDPTPIPIPLTLMAAQRGYGALHYAAEKGQPEVAQRLLAGGANPNLQNEVSRGDGRGGVCDTGWECRGGVGMRASVRRGWMPLCGVWSDGMRSGEARD